MDSTYLQLKGHAAFLYVSIDQPMTEVQIHIGAFLDGCWNENKPKNQLNSKNKIVIIMFYKFPHDS
jgi:hypothetical protein